VTGKRIMFSVLALLHPVPRGIQCITSIF